VQKYEYIARGGEWVDFHPLGGKFLQLAIVFCKKNIQMQTKNIKSTPLKISWCATGKSLV
jgi:hypothetical protein